MSLDLFSGEIERQNHQGYRCSTNLFVWVICGWACRRWELVRLFLFGWGLSRRHGNLQLVVRIWIFIGNIWRMRHRCLLWLDSLSSSQTVCCGLARRNKYHSTLWLILMDNWRGIGRSHEGEERDIPRRVNLCLDLCEWEGRWRIECVWEIWVQLCWRIFFWREEEFDIITT